MVKVKKKLKFDKIWELIQQIDATLGLFLFRDSSKKKCLKERLFALTVPTAAFLMVLLNISTLIVTKFKLINVMFCGMVVAGEIGEFMALTKMARNKHTLQDLFNWCRSLYDIEQKFHPAMQKIIESRLTTMEAQTLKGLKWLRFMLYVDVIGFTLGAAVIGQCLPESVYPKYTLPMPFYLPFSNQETWIAFVTTLATQLIFVVHSATIVIYISAPFICIMIHIFGFLDTVLEGIEKMKSEMFLSLKSFDQEEAPGPSTRRRPKLQLKVLAEVNQNMADKTNQTSFTEWIKILNDMISDVNSIITAIGALYTGCFLLAEATSLCALLFCGLIFTVIHQHYFFGVGVTFITVLLFIVCHINEKFLEKFENIKKALYDLLWYDLDVKQLKMLMILMNCDELQKGFTAAGVHGLTMERFAIIVKIGYKNVLVLKKLVQK